MWYKVCFCYMNKKLKWTCPVKIFTQCVFKVSSQTQILTSLAVLLTSVQSSRLDGRRFSLVLIGGWLFALTGLRTTTGLSSWELSRCPGSDRGVRRRWRRFGAGFTGSPSEDAVSAGPLSVAVSSEGPLLFGTTVIEPPLASFTPFSITETQRQRFY